MAMTAWSAKVLSSSICLSLNGRTSVRRIDDDADRGVIPHQGRGENGPKPGAQLERLGLHEFAARKVLDGCRECGSPAAP